MSEEVLTLKWKHFIPNLSFGLSNVFTENNFSNVTLVSDDKLSFEAHKYVLSAASPLLKKILLSNPHSHPLIYLSDVKHQELELILKFIYLGEASFYQGSMNRFIQAAKDLEIKQLAENVILGNPFIVSKEHVHIIMASKNVEKSYQKLNMNTEYESDGRTISSIADEILNLDIPAYIPGSDELGHVKQSHKSEATLKNEMGMQRHTRTKRQGALHFWVPACRQGGPTYKQLL